MFYARALLVGSKRVKGVRALVYQISSKTGGYYNLQREESIYYQGNDLVVNLLFSSCDNCAKFFNELDDALRFYPLLPLENIQIDDFFGEVRLLKKPKNVLIRHYNSNESNSEAFSVAITRITHVTGKSVLDLETELLMIENSANEDFVGLECYRCHLMSQSEFPQNKDNPNNILWMSWATHQRFDGLNTVDTHRVPQIAISCVEKSDIPVIFENGMVRYKVTVAIECSDDDILAVMRNRVKAGMTVLQEEKKILTYVFVEDANAFENFLTFKYNETRFIWTKKIYGTVVQEGEAHELRRSARLEALKKLGEMKDLDTSSGIKQGKKK
jgi:hypothetical protein